MTILFNFTATIEKNKMNYLPLIVFVLSVFHCLNLYAVQGQPDKIRVLIIKDVDSLRFQNNGMKIIKTSLPADSFEMITEGIVTAVSVNGNILFSTGGGVITGSNSKTVKLKGESSSATLIIKDVLYGAGWWWEGREDRIYEGEILIYTNQNNKLSVVVSLPLEEYLKGVVPYEIGGNSPLEALKAQAVAARSEAVMALQSKLFSGEYYDLTSDVECQVFSGNKGRTTLSDSAVILTKDLILTEKGLPISAYYASNCGGHSEIISNVWSTRTEFNTYMNGYSDFLIRETTNLSNEEAATNWINSKPDVLCNPSAGIELPSWSKNYFRWQVEYNLDTLTNMFNRSKTAGRFKHIEPLERGVSGRIIKANFVFENDKFEVTGELNIRMQFKPALRSSCFITKVEGNVLTLNGAGWGHGVGMCQSGAVSLSLQGKSFNDILAHYYPGTEVLPISKIVKE
ncbi:MAG: SpoIID/LytB domain-containing protein [Ignavibacteriaceae bacterium]|nr:SpoIID/LytB domain-containing protein [Ignavibacteriaceae bacterium]